MLLGIYGAGGLAREVYETIRLTPDAKDSWSDILFIDDYDYNRTLRGHKVLSFQQAAELYTPDSLEFLTAVGEPFGREAIYKRLKAHGYHLSTLVHPSVTIPDTAALEEGTIVGAFSFLSCDVSIGANTYIQNHVSIGHDTAVGSHCVLSAGNFISGHCKIGSCTYIGMSVPVKEKIQIGSGSIIGMGSVIARDIPDGVIAMGNPARAMKHNTEKRVFK